MQVRPGSYALVVPIPETVRESFERDLSVMTAPDSAASPDPARLSVLQSWQKRAALDRGITYFVRPQGDQSHLRELKVDVQTIQKQILTLMSQFARYLGLDYSGAEAPTSSLKGLRLYAATPTQAPVEVLPPPSPRKYWTRRGLAEWLVAELRGGPPTLVGIDHAFSFPLRYFETHLIPPDWSAFLDDFQHHWPTDHDHVYVDFVRDGLHGNGAARTGNSRWRRLTEVRSRTAKSVFHFDVQGSVAKSSHAGIPWLRFLRRELGSQAHFWPFDGWTPPAGVSVIAEAYPALWSRSFPSDDRNPHQHDAYSIAKWMLHADEAGWLGGFFNPKLTPAEQMLARVEGWILGLA